MVFTSLGSACEYVFGKSFQSNRELGNMNLEYIEVFYNREKIAFNSRICIASNFLQSLLSY